MAKHKFLKQDDFARKDKLQDHIKGVHLKLKPFKCETCSKNDGMETLDNTQKYSAFQSFPSRFAFYAMI